MATHSNPIPIPAWRTPWAEESTSMALQRVKHDWRHLAHMQHAAKDRNDLVMSGIASTVADKTVKKVNVAWGSSLMLLQKLKTQVLRPQFNLMWCFHRKGLKYNCFGCLEYGIITTDKEVGGIVRIPVEIWGWGLRNMLVLSVTSEAEHQTKDRRPNIRVQRRFYS